MHRTRQTSRPSGIATTAAAAVCVLAIAACGASGPTGYHNPKYPYGAPNVPGSTSRCMRAKGVSGFPDPREGPNGGGVGFPGGFGIDPPDKIFIMGQTFAGPVVAHAIKACKEYMPPGGPPPAVSESQRVQGLADAACMRRNGVPDFPDPTFGGGGEQLNLPTGVNSSSPAFEHAAQICGLSHP
jgi:hypothetical protein